MNAKAQFKEAYELTRQGSSIESVCRFFPYSVARAAADAVSAKNNSDKTTFAHRVNQFKEFHNNFGA